MDPISIATSAFAAIKSGISVGKELHSLSGQIIKFVKQMNVVCLLYTSPSPRDVEECRMPSSA